MRLVPYRHIARVPCNAKTDGIDTETGENDIMPFLILFRHKKVDKRRMLLYIGVG